MTYSRLRREGCDVVKREKVASKKVASFSGPSPSPLPCAGHWPPVSELHLIYFGMEAPPLIFMGGMIE